MIKHAMVRVWAYGLGFLILGGSVAVHEAAHWGAATLCGVKCESFSLGFGPGLKLGNVGGTDLYIRSIPLGGSVELPMTQKPKAGGLTIAQLSTAQKVYVFINGIFANMAFGLIAMYCYLRVSGEFSFARSSVGKAWEAADEAAALKSRVLEWLGGHVSIFTILSRGAMHGMVGIIFTIGVFNILLGIGNLLPLPGTDGYRIFDALFINGLMSGGHDFDSASTVEVTGILLGLGFLIIPVILGVVPGIIRMIRFEYFLYKLMKRVSN